MHSMHPINPMNPMGQGGARHPKMSFDFNERPMIAIYELTRACHLACAHCRAEAQPHPHPLELKTAESLRVIDEVASLKPMVMVFSGGDPLTRKDLEVLIKHGIEQGLHIAIAPSVTRNLTRQALTRLKDWGISYISLSLDGASPAVHDGFRKVPGTFQRTMQAIEWINELGIPLQINTSVARSTVGDLERVGQIVEDAHAGRWEVFILVPTGRATTEAMLKPEEHEKLYEYLYQMSLRLPHCAIKTTEGPAYRRLIQQHQLEQERKAETPIQPSQHRYTPKAVNDGRGFVFISHIGDIQPSGFLPIAAGNVRTDSLTEVYRHSALFRSLRDPQQFHGKCGVCDFHNVCGGSRARAYALYNDPLGSDPACAYIPPTYHETRSDNESATH